MQHACRQRQGMIACNNHNIRNPHIHTSVGVTHVMIVQYCMLSSPTFVCMHAALWPCFYTFWQFNTYILQHFSENALYLYWEGSYNLGHAWTFLRLKKYSHIHVHVMFRKAYWSVNIIMFMHAKYNYTWITCWSIYVHAVTTACLPCNSLCGHIPRLQGSSCP